jgi:hypothetical protein
MLSVIILSVVTPIFTRFKPSNLGLSSNSLTNCRPSTNLFVRTHLEVEEGNAELHVDHIIRLDQRIVTLLSIENFFDDIEGSA